MRDGPTADIPVSEGEGRGSWVLLVAPVVLRGCYWLCSQVNLGCAEWGAVKWCWELNQGHLAAHARQVPYLLHCLSAQELMYI